eukprot:TRINITY_DN108905_c0_g1_i1.p1 TRINITY_DN108905_c0_g1~~TRINITY_DN108905_c0_g1_i1.p1  ORF type:complete len:547 (+),score=178.60 TRINITY_DN108905_c0_g1_i1:239-1642(+)
MSQWEKPEALMAENDRSHTTPWRQYRIWDGRTFYHNKETKVSCWSMPPELRKLRGESTGLDDRPLPETNAEKRQIFQEFLKAKGLDATWDWKKVQEVSDGASEAQDVSEAVQKQVFAELLSIALRKDEMEAKTKARNAAVALERLIEERFSDPDDLGTTYEDATRILGDEEAWVLIKSDVRRDEVFQNVMERLEEKHQKARAERRTERVVRLQRLIATDPELKRTRLRWKDAAAVLARRDELQEEDPPIEALRVWASLREMRMASEKDGDLKSKLQNEFLREERKRRDAFVLAVKELAAAERVTVETSWAQLEEMLQKDQRFGSIREGQGATAMELFDEFLEELKAKGPDAYAGVEPAYAPEPAPEEPPAKRRRGSRLSADEPPTLQPVKQEIFSAVKMEKTEDEDDTNALDALIAAASTISKEEPRDEAPSMPVKEQAEEEDEEDDPLMGAAMKAAAARKVKEEEH